MNVFISADEADAVRVYGVDWTPRSEAAELRVQIARDDQGAGYAGRPPQLSEPATRSGADVAAKQPNFLFLITDQHRADHTGFGGNSEIQTPQLDALAQRSVRFDRAYVANPICMPNRSTILTGRQPSVHGTRCNGVSLDPSNETFVRVLAEAGWRTALIGKGHFQNMGHGPGAADSFFRTPGDAIQRQHPEGWNLYEDLDRHRKERVAFPDRYYGFDHVDVTVDHGDRCGGHYYQWLLDQGVVPEQLQGPENALQRAECWNQIYQTALPEDLYPTS